MADAGVHVVGTSQHQNAWFLILRAPGQDVAALLSRFVGEGVEGFKPRLDRALRLFQFQIEYIFERTVQLLEHHMPVPEADKRGGIGNASLPKYVTLFQESSFDIFRSSHHAGAGYGVDYVPVQNRRQRVNHRAQENVDLLLLSKDQFAVMSADALDWIATINRTAALAELAPLLFRCIGAEHNVFRFDADRPQEAHPELVSRPDIQHLRNSDPHLRAIFRWRRGGTLLCGPDRQRWETHSWSSPSQS